MQCGNLGFTLVKPIMLSSICHYHSTGHDFKYTKVKESTSGNLSDFDNEQNAYMYFQSKLRDISPFIKMEVVPRMSGVNLNIHSCSHSFSKHLLSACCVFATVVDTGGATVPPAQSLYLLPSVPRRFTCRQNF